jgi:hypothetical protein
MLIPPFDKPVLRRPDVSFESLRPVLRSPASLRQAQGERPGLEGTNGWSIEGLRVNGLETLDRSC